MVGDKSAAGIIGENLAIRSLGVTREELGSLHDIAEKHRDSIKLREAEERANLEKMKTGLEQTGEQFKILIKQIRPNEQKEMKLVDGRFLTVRNAQIYLNRGLLMAITTREGIDLKDLEYETRAGSNSKFKNIEEWQIVGFDEDSPETAYYWDNKALARTDAYWDAAVKVRLGDFTKTPPVDIRQSFSDKSKLISLPEGMFSQK